MIQLWAPLGKKHAIAGIRLSCGGVTYEPTEMLSALSAAWEPTYSAKSINATAAFAFAVFFFGV